MTRDSLPPFLPAYRASGLLLHVTSLPSLYGIGDVGPPAIAWVDKLAEAGQSWWQSLPLGPTGYGDSPYQPLSTFAGNELIISPDWLLEDGLLRASERRFLSNSPGLNSSHQVDYEAVTPAKHQMLKLAWANFKAGVRPDLRTAYGEFRQAQAPWLNDYALFRALKTKYDGAYFVKWPKELVQRDPAALERAQHELADQIGLVCFVQFVLSRQTERLRQYARAKSVGFIGDLPFFVAPDSSDVWANPELFLLDERLRPRVVAGVPPDYFSSQGQLWGNPVYDWDALRQSGYQWWIRRLRALLTQVDVVRLDHFRAFAAAWHIPAGQPTAEHGKWEPGPGRPFFQAVQKELGGALPFIAEDLGMVTPDVYALRDELRLPGMRVLQFAFDGHPDNPHLPDNYHVNAVVYTGTHDNPTTRGWYEDLPDDQRGTLWKYLKRPPGNDGEAAPALMQLAWSSAAALAIAPLQDLLNLGKEARMNFPGRIGGNWRWRYTQDMVSTRALAWIRELTRSSNRMSAAEIQNAEKVLEAVLI